MYASALLALFTAAFATAGVFHSTRFVPPAFAGVATTAVFFLGLVLWSIAACRALSTYFPMRPGRYKLSALEHEQRMWMLHDFLLGFNLTILVHTGLLFFWLRPPLYQALGCPFGRDLLLSGKIFEPHMVFIGDRVVLGEDSIVSGHVVTGEEVLLAPVRIGHGATIGGRAIVMPGVEIGAGSVLAPGSVVWKNTRIPPRELWAGNPACFVRKLDRAETAA